MAFFLKFRRALPWLVVWCVLASVLVGCGGGGGTPNPVVFGRSYQFSNGTQTFVMTVDQTGRFTVFEQEGPAPAPMNGAQGTMASDGRFFARSPDPTLQFSVNGTNNGPA